MCGISGIISLNGEPLNNAPKFVEEMNGTLLHRGPDGSGVYDGESFCFGHTRLSIVDLSEAGHQPMCYLERYVITYNGEVYNHLELRKELEKQGYSFNSHTDTEVIMAAYDCWGAECVKRFNGMWAFVIHDSKSGKFFISRDRFGIKPFFYTKTNNYLIFGSEIKAILAHPEIKAEPNVEYLKRYIDSGPNEYDEATAFEGVVRFPFAHSFEGGAEDLLTSFSPERYWEIKPNLSNERFCKSKAREYADKYYELLSDAVRLRLRADVKVGSALSGGLDSSSIVYLINQHLTESDCLSNQETFSCVYKTEGTEDCDESAFIDSLSSALNVSSNQIEPRECDVLVEHSNVIHNMESPPESTCMSGWHTFKKVNQRRVVVTLDGQGADEQLAGYLPYVPIYLQQLGLVSFYKELFLFLKVPGIRKQLLKAALLWHSKRFFGEGLTFHIYKTITRRAPELRGLNDVLLDATNKGLINLIHYSDRVSMGNSIESRMPFMDYRMVEFLASVPAAYKIHDGWTKYIARLAFDEKLPSEICWRKDKMGWPIPEAYWFSESKAIGVEARGAIQSSTIVQQLGLGEVVLNALPVNKLIRLFNIAVYEKHFLEKGA